MTPAVLLDTAVSPSFLDKSERNHDRAVDVLADLTATLVTCEAVIAESCYLRRAARGAPEAVLQNVERGVFQIPLTLTQGAKPIRALLTKYRSVPMDLADACLVHLADVIDSGRILTLDDDFDVYRWRKTRRFDRLLRRRG